MGIGKTTFSTGLARGLRSSVYFKKSFLETLKDYDDDFDYNSIEVKEIV